jgi:hypothetical protein
MSANIGRDVIFQMAEVAALRQRIDARSPAAATSAGTAERP